MMHIRTYIVSLAALVAACGVVMGQKYPERRHIRKGNRDYETQRFADAERNYRQAQIIDTASVAAAFNLADAQYATEQFAAAENTLSKLAQNKSMTPDEAAKTYYNLGNAQFQQKKLQEALESYKSALRIAPDDMEAKYNFAYTKKLLEEQQQNDQNNQDNKDNKDNKDNQNNQNNQDNKSDNNPDEGDQDQNPDGQPEGDGQDPNQNQDQPQGDKPQPQNPPPPKREVSPETEAMLQAVQQAEDKTRDKVDAQKVIGVGRSGKNW